MMWAGDGWWMFGWGLHWVISLVFLGLLVWGVILLARATGGRSASGSDGALAILKERYARGELTREQFEQMRRELA